MNENHCHSCGGFITDPVAVSYRPPVDGAVTASPNSALCLCSAAVVYGRRRSGGFPAFMSRS